MGEQWIPTVRYCLHCGKKLVGYMDKDGKVKMRCAHCSASIVSKRIGAGGTKRWTSSDRKAKKYRRRKRSGG